MIQVQAFGNDFILFHWFCGIGFHTVDSAHPKEDDKWFTWSLQHCFQCKTTVWEIFQLLLVILLVTSDSSARAFLQDLFDFRRCCFTSPAWAWTPRHDATSTASSAATSPQNVRLRRFFNSHELMRLTPSRLRGKRRRRFESIWFSIFAIWLVDYFNYVQISSSAYSCSNNVRKHWAFRLTEKYSSIYEVTAW